MKGLALLWKCGNVVEINRILCSFFGFVLFGRSVECNNVLVYLMAPVLGRKKGVVRSE